MQMIKSEFKLSIDDDTEADTSTLMLHMLPIPSQRKLQRWVEARAGKGDKAKGGVGDMGGVGGKKGSLKKQRKGAVKKESDQSTRRPTATFVYRQHVRVEWKAEDDTSPVTADDWFECKVIANRDTTPGTFRVQVGHSHGRPLRAPRCPTNESTITTTTTTTTTAATAAAATATNHYPAITYPSTSTRTTATRRVTTRVTSRTTSPSIVFARSGRKRPSANVRQPQWRR